ncbi:peptide deformylase [Chitinophaga filiformis]|uniref:Peptide deformylase n=1 Tax=Chitinophaga filiformis TaxID=104663 RepID=A0A1G7JW95_CHIFI|nr:peptide deformylase [Chitinophaga filiformis]SDF29064.1 peptide deformylase [Chitinophaga filiformis]
MIRPIVAYGAPVLRQQTQKVSKETPGLQQLITDMWQTLDNAAGVGLAAPQIGQPLRIFLVDNRDETAHIRQAFINPSILEYSNTLSTEEEGCLSIPGLLAPVTRPDSITIRYQDADFQTQTATFQGMNARIIQHEYDHVEGRLYLDRLSSLNRTLLRHKLQEVSRGKFRPSYPMQFPLRN